MIEAVELIVNSTRGINFLILSVLFWEQYICCQCQELRVFNDVVNIKTAVEGSDVCDSKLTLLYSSG